MTWRLTRERKRNLLKRKTVGYHYQRIGGKKKGNLHRETKTIICVVAEKEKEHRIPSTDADKVGEV